MSLKYSKDTIRKIRKEVPSGKTKYQVAKEMELSDKVVYYHTRNIPSRSPGRTEMQGKTLEVLKTLLTEGYINFLIYYIYSRYLNKSIKSSKNLAFLFN